MFRTARKLTLPAIALGFLIFAIIHVVKAQQPASKSKPPVEPPHTPFANTVAGAGIVEARTENISIGSHLPGDTHSNIVANTQFSDINSDLCLLPVYVLSYKYNNKLYRFLLNGQTGKAAGDKPLSWQRITIAIVGGLLLLLLIVLLFLAMGAIFGK